MFHPTSPPATRSLALFALSGALAIGISACGSSSPSSTTSAGASGTGVSSTNARYEARLSLAKCLRSHGLNVPDPSPNGGPAGAGGGGGFRTLRDQPNFQSAMQACAKYRRGAFTFGNSSPAQRAKFEQDLVKFAECMRAHNINVPDPSSSGAGGGGGGGIFGQITPSERNSPGFATALKACSSTLPFRRGGGAGGGGAPSPGV